MCELEQFGHGGDLQTASQIYGLPAEQFIDFSANMNPFGPPSAIGELLSKHWQSVAHYPDPAVRRLRCKLAEAYDVPVESIVVGNGAAELIELVVRWRQPKWTTIAQPSFAEYAEAVKKINGKLCEIPLSSANDFTLEEAETMAAWQQAGALFVANPNNPTGNLIEPVLLNKLAYTAKTETAAKGMYQGRTLIVDEAFIDFLPDEHERSLIKTASEHAGVFVIRSMTKFFAIPGLRLGFMVGHPAAIHEIASLQTPWSVNGFAQQIGELVLNETDYINSTKHWLKQEKPWFQEQLRRLGLRVVPGAVNYVLFQLPTSKGLTIQKVQQALGMQGILIRDASNFPGLDHTYGRLAIKHRLDNEKLLKALAEILI